MAISTSEQAAAAIEANGHVVNIGQLGDAAKRWLDREAKAGRLIKYRGFWNSLSPRHGIGPLKTIWRQPVSVAA